MYGMKIKFAKEQVMERMVDISTGDSACLKIDLWSELFYFKFSIQVHEQVVQRKK